MVLKKLKNLKNKNQKPAIVYIANIIFENHPTINIFNDFDVLFKSSRLNLNEMEGQEKSLLVQIHTYL